MWQAGLHKPHLPFYAPPALFALYPDPPAPHPTAVPRGSPYCAWHSCLSRSADAADYSDWGNFSDIPNSMSYAHSMEPSIASRLRRGYAASVSYTDANVGKLLTALDAWPILKAETIVALIGDVRSSLLP